MTDNSKYDAMIAAANSDPSNTRILQIVDVDLDGVKFEVMTGPTMYMEKPTPSQIDVLCRFDIGFGYDPIIGWTVDGRLLTEGQVVSCYLPIGEFNRSK